MCFCFKLNEEKLSQPGKGLIYTVFKKYYTPFLMLPFVKIAVLVLFLAFLLVSVVVFPNIEVGLSQQLAMPEDSYVLKYFQVT